MKKNLFPIGAKLDSTPIINTACKKCGELASECRCHLPKETKMPNEHRLHTAMEKRNGKIVTLIKPFFVESTILEKLAKKLKISLATGGSAKGDTLEFQGECREKVKSLLEKEGYRFK